jgi:hypothetical protein
MCAVDLLIGNPMMTVRKVVNNPLCAVKGTNPTGVVFQRQTPERFTDTLNLQGGQNSEIYIQN